MLWVERRGRSFASPIFPPAFVAAIAAHGLYSHFVYGRGPGAMLSVLPLLAAMGLVAWFLGRDLRTRGDRPSRIAGLTGDRLSRASVAPPSMSALRSALTRGDEPVKVRWVVLGAFVNIGGMIAGLTTAVVGAHLLHVDLSAVDDREVQAAAPVLLLGVGLLASFPTTGWLVARASQVCGRCSGSRPWPAC